MLSSSSKDCQTEEYERIYSRNEEIASIIPQIDYLNFEDFCLNAKQMRSKIFESQCLQLVSKLVKESESLGSEVRANIDKLLSKTLFYAHLPKIHQDMIRAILSKSYD